jgi:hypothetical protein
MFCVTLASTRRSMTHPRWVPEYFGLIGRLAEAGGASQAHDVGRPTCPKLAPFYAAQPVAIGDDLMTTGAQRRGLKHFRSNEVAR